MAEHRPALPCCTNVATWADCGQRAFQKLRPSWLAVGLLLNAGSALTNRGQVMFRPQPLHQLPSLGICAHRCTQANPALLYRNRCRRSLHTGQPCFAAPMLPHGWTVDRLRTPCFWQASGIRLAITWQSLGNRVAILWQSVRFFGNRLFQPPWA